MKLLGQQTYVKPGLHQHFLIKLKYWLRCMRNTHRRTPNGARSREPSCSEPFSPPLGLCRFFSILDGLSHKNSAHGVQSKNWEIRGKKYEVAHRTTGFKFTFFANFKSSIKSSSPWESSKIACKKRQNTSTELLLFMRPNSNSAGSSAQSPKSTYFLTIFKGFLKS